MLLPVKAYHQRCFLAAMLSLYLQQCAVLKELYGMKARAYHGDGTQKDISSWSAARCDVLTYNS
jgi:hypothetical protein